MLTRLKVNGFKNLVDVDISFGPFTCIAGANGVGKSNLFDAITFLSALSEKPLLEAALSVRNEGGQTSNLRSLFHRAGDQLSEEITFDAEMLIPRTGVDELGQEVRAAITRVRYGLTLGIRGAGLMIRREELYPFVAERALIDFPSSRASATEPARPLITTERGEGGTSIRLGTRSHDADKLPRTLLSYATAAESPTAVLVRREMQSWRLLQLEPSALRTSDSYSAPRSLATNGAHLPATLARLAGVESGSSEADERAEALYACVANRLSELVEGVRSIRVDADDRRELFTLMLKDRDGTELEARSLSDGTLRFLALAVLESDPEAQGVLCMEEPENGIHPQRIPAMLRLLQDLAVDPMEPAGEDNPLRQVIVNTHSPAVAAQVPEDSLLVAVPQLVRKDGESGTVPAFRWLSDTWRAKAFPEQPTLAKGQVVSYLNPLEPPPAQPEPGQPRRVMDRKDLQDWLPFSDPA
jgi:predicted ATPase